MLHYWGLRYALLDNEVELILNQNPEVIPEINLKLIDFQNYNISSSSMNVAIVLFFDGFIINYQENTIKRKLNFSVIMGVEFKRDSGGFSHGETTPLYNLN